MMKELSMHIMDIIQNSIRAGSSSIFIEVTEDKKANLFSFSVQDNGIGMSHEWIEKVKSPFATTRTTRKIGLGIPFLIQTCEMCGGYICLDSKEGQGTKIQAIMEYNHIDRPPLGDMAQTIHLLILTNPQITFAYTHRIDHLVYVLDMREVLEILNGLPLHSPEVSAWILNHLKQGLCNIGSLINYYSC